MTSPAALLRYIFLATAVLTVTGCTTLANPGAHSAHDDWRSSMRRAIPADQLGETAYNHVVYSAPFQRSTERMGDDPRSSMRKPLAAERAGETAASHTLYTGRINDHYRAGDGHASMRSAIPASQIGE